MAPDVALLADTLPDLTVSEILAIAKAENLATRLVFFTGSQSDHRLTAAIAAGACRGISKSANPDNVLRSLRLMTKCAGIVPRPLANGKKVYVAKIEKMLLAPTHP